MGVPSGEHLEDTVYEQELTGSGSEMATGIRIKEVRKKGEELGSASDILYMLLPSALVKIKIGEGGIIFSV